MFTGFVVGAATGGAAALYWYMRPAASRNRLTLMDFESTDRVCELVQRITRASDSMDVIATRLERLLHTFPPTEAAAARLRQSYLEVHNAGDARDYCVSLVYGMVQIYMDAHKRA